MTSWLTRLFRSKPAPGPILLCRMSEAEVLRVARSAVEGDEGPLSVHGAQQTPTGIEWRVEARVIGAAPFVRIDDATGNVLEVGRYARR
jgi:hypothetical protein